MALDIADMMTEAQPQRCLYCERPSTRLCDHVIGMLGVDIEEAKPRVVGDDSPKVIKRMVFAAGLGYTPEPESFTCDTPLCDTHAAQGSPMFWCGDHCDVEIPDYCLEHRDSPKWSVGPMYPWTANRERMAIRLRAALRVSRRVAQRWLD